MLSDLKNEIEELEVGEKVKSPLLKIEAFLESIHHEFIAKEEEAILKEIMSYVEKRRHNIPMGISPVNLDEGATLVIHLIPIEAFKSEYIKHDIGLDLSNVGKYQVKPLYVTSYNPTTNANGLFSYTTNYGYTEISTSGIVESVDQGMLSYDPIPLDSFEKIIVEGLSLVQQSLKKTDAKGKYLLSMSLLNVKGMKASHEDGFGFANKSKSFDENDLHLPLIEMESINAEISTVLKPAFDYMWRAFGFSHSRNYINGEFVK